MVSERVLNTPPTPTSSPTELVMMGIGHDSVELTLKEVASRVEALRASITEIRSKREAEVLKRSAIQQEEDKIKAWQEEKIKKEDEKGAGLDKQIEQLELELFQAQERRTKKILTHKRERERVQREIAQLELAGQRFIRLELSLARALAADAQALSQRAQQVHEATLASLAQRMEELVTRGEQQNARNEQLLGRVEAEVLQERSRFWESHKMRRFGMESTFIVAMPTDADVETNKAIQHIKSGDVLVRYSDGGRKSEVWAQVDVTCNFLLLQELSPLSSMPSAQTAHRLDLLNDVVDVLFASPSPLVVLASTGRAEEHPKSVSKRGSFSFGGSKGKSKSKGSGKGWKAPEGDDDDDEGDERASVGVLPWLCVTVVLRGKGPVDLVAHHEDTALTWFLGLQALVASQFKEDGSVRNKQVTRAALLWRRGVMKVTHSAGKMRAKRWSVMVDQLKQDAVGQAPQAGQSRAPEAQAQACAPQQQGNSGGGGGGSGSNSKPAPPPVVHHHYPAKQAGGGQGQGGAGNGGQAQQPGGLTTGQLALKLAMEVGHVTKEDLIKLSDHELLKKVFEGVEKHAPLRRLFKAHLKARGELPHSPELSKRLADADAHAHADESDSEYEYDDLSPPPSHRQDHDQDHHHHHHSHHHNAPDHAPAPAPVVAAE